MKCYMNVPKNKMIFILYLKFVFWTYSIWYIVFDFFLLDLGTWWICTILQLSITELLNLGLLTFRVRKFLLLRSYSGHFKMFNSILGLYSVVTSKNVSRHCQTFWMRDVGGVRITWVKNHCCTGNSSFFKAPDPSFWDLLQRNIFKIIFL